MKIFKNIEKILDNFCEQNFRSYKDIVTFEDACKFIGLDFGKEQENINTINNIDPHLGAVHKINIIRDALNKRYSVYFTCGYVYYPTIKIFPYNTEKIPTLHSALQNKFELLSGVKIDRVKFRIAAGGCGTSVFDYKGIMEHNGEFGCVNSHYGLFGCCSQDIAMHMSKYFYKEIFEAVYGHRGNIEWID